MSECGLPWLDLLKHLFFAPILPTGAYALYRSVAVHADAPAAQRRYPCDTARLPVDAAALSAPARTHLRNIPEPVLQARIRAVRGGIRCVCVFLLLSLSLLYVCTVWFIVIAREVALLIS